MSTAQEFNVVVNGNDYQVYASRSLWHDWRYQSVRGAVRTSMEINCIKDAVEREIEAHIDFCLQLIEDDYEAEEREAHARAEQHKLTEIKRAENDTWNRQIQSAAARQDAQAAHAVAKRLSVNGNTVVLDGQAFGWERTEHGNIKIDRALNDAARKSGLRGQAIGELYSLAQQMVSHG